MALPYHFNRVGIFSMSETESGFIRSPEVSSLCGLRAEPASEGLKPQVRPFDETLSAFKVMKEAFFPATALPGTIGRDEPASEPKNPPSGTVRT